MTIATVMCYVSEAIYPPEFAIKPDLMKAVWFKYMMVDEACKWWRLAKTARCTARMRPHLSIVDWTSTNMNNH